MSNEKILRLLSVKKIYTGAGIKRKSGILRIPETKLL